MGRGVAVLQQIDQHPAHYGVHQQPCIGAHQAQVVAQMPARLRPRPSNGTRQPEGPDEEGDRLQGARQAGGGPAGSRVRAETGDCDVIRVF